MFDVCTTRDTAHIDTIFKLLPHTHQSLSVTCYAVVKRPKNYV